MNDLMLPKIDLPVYELKLPSNGNTVRVRPFIVKEEKLLLMAVESGDTNEIINITKQVINNCLIDKDVDINSLPFFDVDYLFIALRAKSIGEKINTIFKCKTELEDETICNTPFDVSFDISKCDTYKDDSIKSDIKVQSDILVKMKYPGYSIMKYIMDTQNVLDRKVKIIAACIDRIIQKDKIYSSKDMSREKMVEFVEGLTEAQYKMLENYIDNFPYFYYSVNHTCTSCGFQHNMRYTDFSDFF